MNVVDRLGFIYPQQGAVDDYQMLAASLTPSISVHIVRTLSPTSHDANEWLRHWHERHLLESATKLPTGIKACLWACTSGSFVFGLEGAHRQVEALAQQLQVPTSSTSLAYLAALQALRIQRVAIAATYPNKLAAAFGRFLESAGVQVVHIGCMGIWSGADVAALDHAEVQSFVELHSHPHAEAVLIPDTALPAHGLVPAIEARLAKPVLAANIVTLWYGLRLAGYCTPQPQLGHLMHYLE